MDPEDYEREYAVALKWFKKKDKAKKVPQETPQKPIDQAPGLESHEEAAAVQEAPLQDPTPLPPETPKQGLFRILTNRLSKTRGAFLGQVDQLLRGKKEIDETLLEELEEILITSDIGVQTSMALIERVREGVERKALSDPKEIKSALQHEILAFFEPRQKPNLISHTKPYVILVVGVNGVGKTTTIGKLAAHYRKEGKRVLLVAADTFRAAAVEQLEIWGERVGAEVIRHKGKSDPSAVVYDGMQAAISRGVDIAIIDTAGRLHTKVNLMEQIKKVCRTVSGQIPGGPHETLLVLDATTGQNAISQAELFHKALQITGIALAKLDGTAKGGVVVSICHGLGLPLQYVGLGEKTDDLQEFDASAFVRAMFDASWVSFQ